MAIHLKSEGIPLSAKDWARCSGVVYKAFWDRLKRGQWSTKAQRKQRALSTEAAKAEEAAREAMLRAIRETKAAEEEREAELARLRGDITLRWFASDEYRKVEKHNKRQQKRSKHRISRRKDGASDRRH